MARFRLRDGSYSPGEAVRLLWGWLTILSPLGALAYVRMFELGNGNEESLIRVLLILAVSMVITLISVVAFPMVLFDEIALKRVGRFSLCLALVHTIIVALLLLSHFSAQQACQLGATCRTYPVGWIALAGMHYCYAVWAYGINLLHR